MLISGCATLSVFANNMDAFNIFSVLILSVKLPERHLNKESFRTLKRKRAGFHSSLSSSKSIPFNTESVADQIFTVMTNSTRMLTKKRLVQSKLICNPE